MKRYILLIALFVGLLYSCKDQKLLDPVVTNELNRDVVFADSLLTMRFLYGVYGDAGYTFSYKRWENIFNGTDDAAGEGWATLNGPTQPFVMIFLGTLNPTDNVAYSNAWDAAWRNIRKVNVLLADIGRTPLSENGKKQVVAEARFLRAWYYATLVKNFGGVPLLGDRVFEQHDDFSIPRNTYEQCVNYIVSELDAVAGIVPDVQTPENYGRVTKGMALGVKARVLLYAASPLFNGGGISTDQKVRELTGYPTANQDRWRLAADAAEAVMKTGLYSLVENNQTAPGYGFYEMFLQRKNTEYVFPYMQGPNRTLESRLLPPSRGNNTVNSMPTQNLVDAFGMIDGKPVVSGKVIEKSPLYDDNDPYKNRDPRFNYTIIYNGTMWYRQTSGKKEPIYTYFEAPQDGFKIVKASTGYFWRKMMNDNSSASAGANTDRCLPLIRYADILLMFAEAKNELGDVNAAYDQLKLIRRRAGIIPGAEELYGLKKNMTKEEMREVIQSERRVEFAYEDQRYWDVRRWKIAPKTQTQTIYVMNIKPKQGGGYTYNKEVADPAKNAEHIFKDASYLFPIPQSEINRSNRALIQNPGY